MNDKTLTKEEAYDKLRSLGWDKAAMYDLLDYLFKPEQRALYVVDYGGAAGLSSLYWTNEDDAKRAATDGNYVKFVEEL